MIDMHAHLVPAPLVDTLRRRESAPNLSAGPDGDESLGIYRTRIPYSSAFDDVPARLALMDELGITHQVLSLPGLFGIDSARLPHGATMTRQFNDGVAATVADNPDRFTGLASLPLADPAAAVSEYRRARRLGLSGMILPGDAFANVAAAQWLRPLFAVARELGGLVFVHPGPTTPAELGGALPTESPHSDNIVHRRATVDIQNRLTEVMITLAISDYLDDFADVPVQVANLGGALPFVIERMDHVYALRHPDLPLPSASLRPVYVDTASMGPKALDLAIGVYGADRILFGTDCPVFDPARSLESVDQSRIGREVLIDNATRLLSEIGVASNIRYT